VVRSADHLPALVVGGAIRNGRLRDISGRELVIEAEEEPPSPIIDGERFTGSSGLRSAPDRTSASPSRDVRQMNCETVDFADSEDSG
jgi:hypothetical protein